MRLVGAIVAPLVLTACYGSPPCEGEDLDGDGFSTCDAEECDDTDPEVNADAEEICDDEIDNNCDGILASTDGVEVCGNELDDDCDGEIDELADEPGVEADCFDGLDDDCDGISDENDPDCVDSGDIVVTIAFEADVPIADCAAAGLTELTVQARSDLDNSVNLTVACDNQAITITAPVGDYTLQVNGVSADGRSWTSGDLQQSSVLDETRTYDVTLTCSSDQPGGCG